MKLILAVAIIATCLAVHADCLAVMSVDLGSEFMKIAIVKPGVPMEIVLNDESRRKTPVAVSMRNEERLFGDPALIVGIKKPKNAYWFTRDLLGKTTDNPTVVNFQKNFPFYEMEVDPETNMAVFRHDEETTYTPEELMAMILEKAKATAEKFAEQPIHDAVITVPPYYNQAERRALMRAATMAGIKVLQLMNDNAAVALNYGVFRRKEFTNTSVHYVFVDVGSSSAVATVVGYSTVKEKNKVTGIVDSFPQATVKGVGYDSSLGGVAFQLRLRDYLAKLFNNQKKTSTDVTTNARSMQKLFKEAGRLMQVLSANTEHFAQVESLFEDIDFRALVKREEFEELCADLFERLDDVIEEAMSSSEMTWDEISEVILMGGATRIPKVQTILKEVTKREELGKSINTDEAAALGAVYQAAHLSKGFKVKKFAVKDANIYPIQVEFERVQESEDTASKTIRRVLFGRMNPFPQKKVMTFNKQTSDFQFAVNYGDLDFMSDAEKQSFGSKNLHQVSLKGVGDVFEKHSEESEAKGVKAHFRMDESGILTLDKVEALFEKTKTVEEEAVETGEEESTLSKIGNTISNLFGGSKDEEEGKTEDATASETNDNAGEEPQQEENKETEETEKQEAEEKASKETGDGDEKSAEDEAKKETGEEKVKEDEKKEKEEEKEEDTKTEKNEKSEEKVSDKAGDKKEEAKEKKPKIVTIKEDIGQEVNIIDITDPSDDQIKASRKKIEDLKKRDEEKKKLEQVKNDIESFIFQAQDKLYQEVYEQCSTEEQREEIRTAMSEASDWLYEQDDSTERKVYEKKLKDLKKTTKELEERVKEVTERPRALEAFNSVVNYSTHFLMGMAEYIGEDKPFTQVELETLTKTIKDALEWNKTMHEEQEKVSPTEKPKLLLVDIAQKINELDREVKYLINKAKTFRPKPKPKEDKKKKNESTSNDTKTEETTVSDDGAQADSPPPPDTETPEKEVPEVKEEVKNTEEEEPILELGDEGTTEDHTEGTTTKKDSKHKGDEL